MKFEAELTNPKPKGLIHAKGNLGPWRPDDPGETAVNGTYTFDHADLATFKGIAGILASTGSYAGTLREMVVDGNADVPDFRLPQFGNALALHTRFHARVDGTDGDTWLDPVEATLGKSHFITRGQVVRVKPRAAGQRPQVTPASLPPLADLRTRYRLEGEHRPRTHRGLSAAGEPFGDTVPYRCADGESFAAYSPG